MTPSSWSRIPLGDAVNLEDRLRRPVKAADRINGPYPYYGASGIVDWVSEYIFDYPTLLVSEDGENLKTRKTPIAFIASGKYWVNNHAHVLTAKPGYDLDFLAYAVEYCDISGYLTGSTQPKLTAANLARITLLAPSYELQKRIAGVLGSLDRLIRANTLLMAEQEQLLATEFARSGFDRPGSTRLDELILVNPPRVKPKGSAPYIDMASLSEQYAGIEKVVERTVTGGARFMNGDTLMARITPCLENGKIGFVDCLDEGVVGIGSTEFFVLRSDDPFPRAWSYALARSPRFRDYVVRHMTGTSGRQRCPVDAVSGYLLEKPRPEALQRFRSVADPVFESLKGLRLENESLRATRDELIPLLLTGRITTSEVDA